MSRVSVLTPRRSRGDAPVLTRIEEVWKGAARITSSYVSLPPAPVLSVHAPLFSVRDVTWKRKAIKEKKIVSYQPFFIISHGNERREDGS